MKKMLILLIFGLSILTFSNVGILKAIDIAKKEAKGYTFKSIELEKNRYGKFWDVELVKDDVEMEYRIDQKSGNVVSSLKERYYGNYKNSNKIIDVKKVIEIVSKQIKNPLIDRISLDYEYGNLVYEVEVINNYEDLEIVIDAIGGEIIRVDD